MFFTFAVAVTVFRFRGLAIRNTCSVLRDCSLVCVSGSYVRLYVLLLTDRDSSYGVIR
jgi:hypothetical protein